MKFQPGELVTFKDFHAKQRCRLPVMIVLKRITRLKSEGAYYQVIDDGEVVLYHSSQIRYLDKEEATA
tara:strand:+ start:267 stop:470 length:204 start_codon:yes stop_codon:yes gene_type:complete